MTSSGYTDGPELRQPFSRASHMAKQWRNAVKQQSTASSPQFSDRCLNHQAGHKHLISFPSKTMLTSALNRARSSRPCSALFVQVQVQYQTQQQQQQHYTSRAHPTRIPHFGVESALAMVLEDVEGRVSKRAAKWERNAPNREKRGIKDEAGGFRNQDETIELALNLNLDPRKPGQSLRGSLALPHGSGKKPKVVVFTKSEESQKQALEMGAIHAGGEELVDRIKEGLIDITNMDRVLASQDLIPALKPLARTLGPRGLYPNAKDGTILQPDQILAALDTQLKGAVAFRTEKSGIVQMGIGKGSFGDKKLLENLRYAMEEMFEIKPESFGKGKKGGPGKGKTSSSKNTKYLLKAHVTSTMGKGVKLDIRTVDPTSAFFMTEVAE